MASPNTLARKAAIGPAPAPRYRVAHDPKRPNRQERRHPVKAAK